jgi:DNA repair protein RadC
MKNNFFNDSITGMNTPYEVKDISAIDRLLNAGSSSLSDAELISIITGDKEKILKIYESVNYNLIDLQKLTIIDLMKIGKLSKLQACKIRTIFELCNRRREANVIEKKKITSSRDIFELFQNLGSLKYEEFWILLLNRANKIIKKIKIGEGGISGTVADPKKIFNFALENNSSSIILIHNHPSGSILPSDADMRLTDKVKQGGLLLDMPILDHVIIGEVKYYSFKDEGKM